MNDSKIIKKKKEEEKIFQSNKYTLSRSNYTALQKNIMYYVLYDIKKKLYDKNEKLNEHLIVNIPMKNLDKTGKNYVKTIKGVKGLTEKSVEFETLDGKSEIYTNIVMSAELIKGTGNIELEIHKDLVNLISHNYQNFTAFYLTQAITLKSIYSKRMYELCHCWKNLGEKTIKLSEIRHILAIENKYKEIPSLKVRVLNHAQKELKNTEINFKYELIKKDFGKGFDKIKFIITEKKEKKAPKSADILQEYTNSIYSYLETNFGKDFNVYLMINEIKRLNYVKKTIDIINIAKTKEKPQGYFVQFFNKEIGEGKRNFEFYRIKTKKQR